VTLCGFVIKEKIMENRIQSNEISHGIAIKIAAKSFFKELKSQGFNTNEIIRLSSELIHMVSTELRAKALNVRK